MPASRQSVMVFFLAGCLSACCSSTTDATPVNAETPPPEKLNTRTESVARGNEELENQLRSILSANPEADAKKAGKAGNNSLWGYNERSGKVIPGIKSFSADAIKTHPVQIAPGMGDVVYGKTHLELRIQFIKYATIYNQTIMQVSAP